MRRAASFSADGRYRYSLKREWADGPRVCFVMLNPSIADAARDDQTIRRCISFARDWGYGSLVAVNLFAYISTDPAGLRHAADPIGPRNDVHSRRAHRGAALTVAAWGAHPSATERGRAVMRILGSNVRSLALTQSGAPRHPSRLRRDAIPQPWVVS